MSNIWGKKIILHDPKTQYLNTSLTSLIFRCTYHLNTDLSSPAIKCHMNIRPILDLLMLFYLNVQKRSLIQTMAWKPNIKTSWHVTAISITDESDIRIPTANWKFYFFRFQVFLGGEDQRHLDYKSRLENCRVFARAINKPSLPDYAVVRAKEMFGLESIGQIINGLQPRVLKGAGMRDRLTWDVELHAADPASTRYFCPAGKLRGIYATCKILLNMFHSTDLGKS